MTLTLIHSPRSRSTGFIWLLEELGAPYDIRRVTIRRAGGEAGLAPANPHPHGKVPALLHDGVLIHEQAAIDEDRLSHGFTIIGMLWFARHRARLRRRWGFDP